MILSSFFSARPQVKVGELMATGSNARGHVVDWGSILVCPMKSIGTFSSSYNFQTPYLGKVRPRVKGPKIRTDTMCVTSNMQFEQTTPHVHDH